MGSEVYFKTILEAADIYKQTYPEDVSLILTDLEQIVKIVPFEDKSIHLQNAEVGTRIADLPGALAINVIGSRQTIQIETPAHIYGVSLMITVNPILYEGVVIGTISAAMMSRKWDTVRHVSHTLEKSVADIVAHTQEITLSLEATNEQIQSLSSQSDHINQNAIYIQNIIRVVEEIADTTNLLGLNASIEAAHAGQFGAGFSVVANEIRRMSTDSKKASETIRQQLLSMDKILRNMNQSLQLIGKNMVEHVSSIGILSESIAQIENNSVELNRNFIIN
ncbi:methyl-accepting chemotaxis protein [Paenibacillus xylanexedens]|uniref:methyl-accepting chemotaxis protein n=1 Tax=Paenibacillus xylanexedens TaxID=528191 RepID=UPI0011A617DE|nr:methyl-accepting chemotaxis protein [Paenibacillus xylanexedens]